MYTPDANMGLVDYRTHTLYLAHDLYVTEALYHRLWRRMTRRQRLHYRGVASPLIHLLCDLFAPVLLLTPHSPVRNCSGCQALRKPSPLNTSVITVEV